MTNPIFKKSAAFFSNDNWGLSHVVWLVVLAIIWLGSLGWRHLIPSDEGRYAEIAREMLVSGDWLVPRYNDYLYFEKPPLHMWVTAVIFKLFGLGEWQARAWSGVTSFANILMVGYTSYKLWGVRAGTISALVLASCPLWIIGGHFNSLDMGIAFFMSSSLCCLILALNAPLASLAERNWMLMCWAMMALAVLSKGLIGIVLPGLVLVVYSVTCSDWYSWRRMHWIKGGVLFFIISAPWFVLLTLEHPSFFDFFFIHEHFERFTTNEHQRGAPWHFFIPLILVGVLPWLTHLPQAIWLGWLDRKKQNHQSRPLYLCLIWVFAITVFFSLSHSKLPGYIFPVIPAIAILLGYAILQLFESKKALNPSGLKLWRWQLFLFGTLFLIGLFFVPKIANIGETYEAASYASYARYIAVALVIGLIGCILAWLMRKNTMLSFITFSSTIIILALTAGIAHETVGRLLSGYDIAMQAKPLIKANDHLYGVGILDHTIPFYLEHPLIMVDFKDELAFGISQEPKKWIPTEEEWLQVWSSPDAQKAFALMTPQYYASLQKKNIPMKVIAEDSLRIIVSNQTLP
jgi:4-amino-4-deoxy-L-arabinose transferase-like glycosyltransferase